MITMLINLLVLILVVALIFGIIIFLVRRAPFIVEPYRQWTEWALIVIAVLIVIRAALPMVIGTGAF